VGNKEKAMPDADDVQRNVRWYQVILATACGYVDVPINGNHNDSQTRSAFRDFQQSHGLEASGYLTVESNIALNQVALESIYRRSLPIKAGQASDVLRDQIKEFQTDYGLANDGKVGTLTMQKMMDVLSGLIPRPYSEWRPEHSTESVLRDDEAEERPGPGPLLTEGAAVTDTGVFGADDRVAQSNTIKEPNRWVCLINTASDIMTLKYEPTGIEQVRAGFTWSLGGSGLLISPRHILTAAHVVQQLADPDSSGRYTKLYTASGVELVPGHNGAFADVVGAKAFRKPYGTFQSDRFRQPAIYLGFSKHSAVPNSFADFALIELSKPIHMLAPRQKRTFLLNGKVQVEERQLPALGYWGGTAGFSIKAITPAQIQGQTIETIGYPSKIPDVETRPKKKWMQWRATGKVNNSLSNQANHPYLLFHTAETTDSQSGSPIWTVSGTGDGQTCSLVGIVTAASNTFNVAVALTERVLAQIETWAPDTFEVRNGELRLKPTAKSSLGGL
jgi:V8-like Glu-specific endopeptidase